MLAFRMFQAFAATAALTGAAVGCGGDGPELASVEGTVLLDGTPLENAKLVFTPTGPGRPSSGRTDASGKYSLSYTSEEGGAILGEHLVDISTYVRGDVDSGTVGAPERLPMRYNRKSELKRAVESGGNVIDFELESNGKIVQPKDE